MKNIKAITLCLTAFLLTGTMGFAETYQSVEITADKLNVREGMTLEAPIIGKLDQKTIVMTSDLTDGWYKTSYLGQPAYISADYAQVVEAFSPGNITGQNVNLRDTPSVEEGRVISQLSNAEIKIHAKQDNWYSITTQDGVEGYVFADFVSFENTVAPVTPQSETPDEILVPASTDASNLIDIAKSKLGCPYAWAQEGPNSFDCSGFVKYCFKEAYGIELPHSASAISQKGTTISKENLQPGDVVFFATLGSATVNHTGIYIGNGEFIHASSSSSNGHQVHINPINTGYYNTVYQWAKRLSID